MIRPALPRDAVGHFYWKATAMVHVRTWFDLARHDEDAPPAGATPPAAPPVTPPEPPTPPPAEDALGEAGKKALTTEREARKAAEKAASDLAARVKEFEDRDKSEADKAAERLAAAEKTAADALKENVRLKVIAETGLPPAMHKFLSGADEAELRANAAELAAATAGAPPAPGHVPPAPNGAQGGDKTPPPPVDMRTATPAEVAAAKTKLGIRGW